MSKRKNTVLFNILFIFGFVYVNNNSDLRVIRRFFILLQLAQILMFEGLDPANAKNNPIIPRAYGFKPPRSRPNQNNLKLNNPLVGVRQNISKEVSSGANQKLSDTIQICKKKQGLYARVTGFGESGSSSSKSSADDSNPFNTKSSNQGQNPNYFNQIQKKKKKGYDVNISEDRFIELSTNP